MPVNSYWRAVILLTFTFFLNFLSRTVFSPLLPRIETDFSIDHLKAGYLFVFIASGYFIALWNSGAVSGRLGHKRTLILSALGVAIFLFCAATIRSGHTTYILLAASAFGVGLAAGIYLPSGIATLTSITPQNEWGKVLAAHEVAPNLAFVTAPLLVETVGAWFSWRVLLYTMSIVVLLVAATMILCRKYLESPVMTISCTISRFELIKDRTLLAWVMIFGIGITGTIGIYAMLPLFLVSSLGYDQMLANKFVGISRIASIFMALFSGWLIDRLHPGVVIKVAMLMTGIFTVLIGIAPSKYVPTILFLQAATGVCFFPAAFSLVSQGFSQQCRSLAISTIMPVAFLIGGGLAPAFIGYMAKTNRFGLGFAVTGLWIITGLILMRFTMKQKQPHRG